MHVNHKVKMLLIIVLSFSRKYSEEIYRDILENEDLKILNKVINSTRMHSMLPVCQALC